MRELALAAALFVSLTTVPARAEVKGTFVGPGIYATDEGCVKQALIESGGEQNVGTVPETLTEDGFSSWESSCTFTKITEKTKGRVWSAEMACASEAEEDTETDLFERLADGKIKVTVQGKVTLFERCDADKGK